MSSNITVQGPGGKRAIIYNMPDNNGDNTFVNDINDFDSQMNHGVNNGTLKSVYLPSQEGDVETDTPLIGVVNSDKSVTIDDQYKYIVVSGTDDENDTTTGAYIDASNTTASGDVTIIGGKKGGFSYTAGNESGTIYNTTGNLNFYSYHKSGNWTIKTATGNANITTTSGKNSISIGCGMAYIRSLGQDNISVNIDDPTSQYYSEVTLGGGNSTVSAGQGSSIIDVSGNNIINTYQGSTVTAGTSGVITFTGTNEDTIGNNTVQGGIENTISGVNTNITAIQGNNNTFSNISENLTFFNGYGDTNVTMSKRFVGFGANGLNLTLNTTDTNQTNDQSTVEAGLFVADKGNETLNASGYDRAIQIYANTVTGATSRFTAVGTTGDDVIAAGTGNSTFTGGAGNNLFMFIKDAVGNGTTTITDFARQGSDNHIGLYGYGLNTDSVSQLISNAQSNIAGYAVLNLSNHEITLQGVTVADLKVSQFFL